MDTSQKGNWLKSLLDKRQLGRLVDSQIIYFIKNNGRPSGQGRSDILSDFAKYSCTRRIVDS